MKSSKSLRRFSTSVAGFESLEGRRLFAATYTVTDLAPDTNGIEHTGHAYGISDDGTKVAGEYDGHASVWVNGVREDLGFSGYATDVNNSGVVVGVDTLMGTEGFIWKAGTEHILNLAGNTHGVVSAINNNNEVAGTLYDNASVAHAVVAGLNGTATDIGVPSGGFTGASGTGINDAGQVIGTTSQSGTTRAFIYSGNTFKVLGPLPGGGTVRTAHGISSNGTTAVAGSSGEIYTDGTTKIYHVYTIGSNGYGTPADKGTYGNFYDLDAADISENGKNVIGNNDPGLFDGQGIINTGSGFKLIDNLVDPVLGLRFRYASAVNDQGKIVGYGTNSDGQINPYLLTPVVVAPSTFAISGKLWGDTDKDGTFDAGEPVAGNRTVFIDTNGNGKLDSGEKQTQSNASGQYTFSGLTNGTYKISRVFPSGYHLTNGSGHPYVSATINNASVANVNLGSGSGVVAAKGSISGVLFGDTDKDGILDAGEPVAASRTVFIDTNGNKKLDGGEISTTSDAQGKYLLAGLDAGTYKVTRVFPAGYKLSNNSTGYITVSLATGQAKAGVNIGSRTV